MVKRNEQIFSRSTVIGVFDSLVDHAHATALKKGFYDEKRNFQDMLDSSLSGPSVTVEAAATYTLMQEWLKSTAEQAAIARMHSELSEWLEGIRKNPDTRDSHCPEFLSAEIEAADLIIRVMDTCGEMGYRLGAAILAKMAYNQTRPHKHGKNS